jgi:hypothetical protein
MRKQQSAIYSMTVPYEAYQALRAGRQRYLLISADIHPEGGDFIEIIEGAPEGVGVEFASCRSVANLCTTRRSILITASSVWPG